MPDSTRLALSRFGKIAIDKGYLAINQLQECVRIQDNYEQSGRPAPQLGVIIIAKKYMTAEQVSEVIKLQNDELHSKVSDDNKTLTFAPGGIIFYEHDHSNFDLFFLRQGTVNFYRDEILIEQRSGVGVFFGVAGYLLKQPRSATAVAKTGCEVLQINEKNADNLFRMKPDLAIRMATSLSHSLQQTIDAYVNVVSTLPAPLLAKATEKIASRLPSVIAPLSAPPSASKTPVASVPIPVAKKPIAAAQATVEQMVMPTKVETPQVQPPKMEPPKPEAPKIIPPKTANPPIAPKMEPTKGEIPNAETVKAETKVTAPPVATVQSSVEKSEPAKPDSPKIEEITTALEEIPVAEPAVSNESEKLGAEPATGDLSFRLDLAKNYATGEELFADISKIAVKPISDAALEAVEKRIGLYLQVEKLEEQRVALEQKYPAASESFKIEIARQRREYMKIPALNMLQTQLEKLQDKVKNSPIAGATPVATVPDAAAPVAAEPAAKLSPEEEAAKKLERAKKALAKLGAAAEFLDPSDFADTEFSDDEPEEEAAPQPDAAAAAEVAPAAKKLPPITVDIRDLLLIGIKQKEILIKRAQSTEKLLQLCAEAADNEPFFAILQKRSIDPAPLFGWGILTYALKNYAETANQKIKELRKRSTELTGKINSQSGGFLGMGGKQVDDDTKKEMDYLAEQDKRWKLISTNIGRDNNANESEMVGVFWNLYETLGQTYTTRLTGVEGTLIRGFLRWGMLGVSPRWLAESQMKTLILDCFPAPVDPTNRLEETALYYADEVIFHTANGKLPPSPNEDLELNHRNSNEWKVDRAWRKLINGEGYNTALQQILSEQNVIVEDARKNVAQLEDLIKKTHASNHPDKKKIIVKMKDQMQNDKVRAARAEKTVERLNTSVIPYNGDEIKRSQEVLDEIKTTPAPADLAKHEIGCLRRNARLVAKLKEPFLPFTLRDRFKPEMNCANTREALLAMLKDVELRDPIIFLEPLIPNAKKLHQVFMRRSPVIIIAPAGGVLGFIMGPRQVPEGGRFVLPSYVERANMREEILWSTLSDFRYDTSKVSAGVDVMTSDTLVAAYATVRWNLRKREREARQKAGIYMEENERTNWRRHYALYMKSALDSGKLLFFKCPELYELIINKFIDLPAGTQILKR